jgi:hypothetical protein
MRVLLLVVVALAALEPRHYAPGPLWKKAADDGWRRARGPGLNQFVRCGGRVAGGRALEQEHEDAGSRITQRPEHQRITVCVASLGSTRDAAHDEQWEAGSGLPRSRQAKFRNALVGARGVTRVSHVDVRAQLNAVAVLRLASYLNWQRIR